MCTSIFHISSYQYTSPRQKSNLWFNHWKGRYNTMTQAWENIHVLSEYCHEYCHAKAGLIKSLSLWYQKKAWLASTIKDRRMPLYSRLHQKQPVATICNLWRQHSTILQLVSYQKRGWLGCCQPSLLLVWQQQRS